MRNFRRSTTAVVLIAALAMPAAAASRQSRSAGFANAVKRFVIRAMSRISPPGGAQEPVPEGSTTTTTDATPTTKTQ